MLGPTPLRPIVAWRLLPGHRLRSTPARLIVTALVVRASASVPGSGICLAPSGLALPIVIIALGVFLAWSYRSSFAGVLRVNAIPDAAIAPRSSTAQGAAV